MLLCDNADEQIIGKLICFILLNLKFRRKIYDEYNDEEIELTKEETKIIRRLLKGKAPHAEFDPHPVCSSHVT